MKTDVVYLVHILDAIEKIRLYTQNVDYIAFCENTMCQDAVLRQIEIIGEATKQISHNLKNLYPQIPWKDIAGTRDIISHKYFGVDIDEVWMIITDDLSKLESEIRKILNILQSN